MTGREAIEVALNLAQKIEVKGKQNVVNLLTIMNLLEGVLENESKGGNTYGGDNQKTVEHG